MTVYPNYQPRDITDLKIRVGRFNWFNPRELRRFLMSKKTLYGWTWVEDRGFWSSYFIVTGEYRYLKALAKAMEG